MSLIEIDWHPARRQLRVFGLSAMAASLVLSAVLVFLWHAAAIWALIVLAAGAAILVCSLVSPGATRVVYLVLTIAAAPIGLAVSLVMLAAFYFLLLTPVGLLFRLIGRDPLHRAFDRKADSYWVPRGPPPSEERYFHQS
jgi:hypothetical protein